MGRKKISIKQIADPKLRHITFNKRKNGLIKKAAELSLLCNINMLLVFEDGAGNLVQFSKNKISSLSAFFQECKYNKLVELTAKEYPNFFKVNHYKKSKYPDGEGEHGDLDDDSSDNNNGNSEIYGFSAMEAKQETTKNNIKDPKPREGEPKKEIPQHLNPFAPPQPKAEMGVMMDNERAAAMASNGTMHQDPKKIKPKQNLRLNVAKPEDGSKPHQKNGESSTKAPSAPGDVNDAAAYNPYNQYKKDNFQEEQMKQINEKNMEYNASTFITPNLDQAKRLGGVPDPMNSPFNFYPSNGRLRPFNNYGLGAFGSEDFNNILKYSSFGFPMPGNPQFMGKPGPSGDIDEKQLFDHTKMLNYFNQAGSTPMGRQNMFNFPQNEFQKIAINGAMGQGNNRNEPEYYNNYGEEPHDEMPPAYKGDPRFEGNLPSANLSNRRYNSDTYFNSGFDEEYGAERQKKLKHN